MVISNEVDCSLDQSQMFHHRPDTLTHVGWNLGDAVGQFVVVSVLIGSPGFGTGVDAQGERVLTDHGQTNLEGFRVDSLLKQMHSAVVWGRIAL